MTEILLRAALAALGVAAVAGTLGAFVVWRRMVYFGDAIAHAAILGVALALVWDLPVTLGTLAAAVAVAFAVARLVARGHTVDAALGVLSHGMLALGLLAFYLWGQRAVRGVSLEAFLFGDILVVSWSDVAWIWLGAAAVLALLAWRWQALLTATLNEELARSAGIDPGRERLLLTLALALTVAVALKVVGVLLISAMLIIPAAAARTLARSPEAMALLAVAIGAASALGGLALSVAVDVPAGPAIVAVAFAAYAAASALSRA